MVIEVMALQLILHLLFEADADQADDDNRMPLDLLIAGVLDDRIDEIDPETEETDEWMQLMAAMAARALLNVASWAERAEDPEGEAYENDNGSG